MSQKEVVCKILVSSPSDVQKEKSLVHKIAETINKSWGEYVGVRLDVLSYESSFRPGISDYSQNVINQQLGDNYDIYLGIFWSRFGTPTKEYNSGTEEEFERAYERHKSQNDAIEILFYFKTEKVPIDQINGSQIEKIKSFKKKIAKEKGVLYCEFVNSKAFKAMIYHHLSKIMQSYNDKENGRIKETVGEIIKGNEDGEIVIEDCLKLFELASKYINKYSEIIDNMTDDMTSLGSQTHESIDKINHVNQGGGDFNEIKRTLEDLADGIEKFEYNLSMKIPEMTDKFMYMVNYINKIIIVIDDFNISSEVKKRIKEGLEPLSKALKIVFKEMKRFDRKIIRLPRLTTKINIAKNKANRTLSKLLKEFEKEKRTIDSILKLL